MISKVHSKNELYQYWVDNDTQVEEIEEVMYLVAGFAWHRHCMESATTMNDFNENQHLMDVDRKYWEELRESYKYLPANIEWFAQ